MLRSLAYDPTLFERCVHLLADLAVHDDDEDRSDAAAALKSLFFAHLSGTHATAEQRIQVMESFVRSPDPKKQGLGLQALDALLEASHFSSAYDFSFGSRSRNFGYRPTFPQIRIWYAAVLKSAEALAGSALPAAAKVPGVVAASFCGLWTHAQMHDDLERVSHAIASKGYWREGWIAIRQTLTHGKADLSPEEGASSGARKGAPPY
jgi:hypothetical protein